MTRVPALLGALLRHEAAQIQFVLANALLAPGALFYFGTRLSDGAAARQGWLAGALALGVGITAASSAGFALVEDRFRGRLALLKALPIRRRDYLGALLALAALEGAAAGLGAGALLALTGADPSAVLWVGSFGVCVLTALALAGVAAAAAARPATYDASVSAVLAVSIVAAFASPTLYPSSALPEWLRAVAWLSPYTHAADALRTLAASGTPAPSVAAALLISTAGWTALAARWLRW
jgi:ABC-type multidrug transport system permease subunit